MTAWTFVQGKGGSVASGGSTTFQFGTAPGSGHVIVIAATSGLISDTITVSDNDGNTWNATDSNTGDGGDTLETFWAVITSLSPNANPTFTITWGGTTHGLRFAAGEFAPPGTGTITAADHGSNGSTSSASSSTVSTAGSAAAVGDAVFGILRENVNTTLVAGTGYTLEAVDVAAPSSRVGLEFKTATGAGSQTATFTWTGSATWMSNILVLNQSSGGTNFNRSIAWSVAGGAVASKGLSKPIQVASPESETMLKGLGKPITVSEAITQTDTRQVAYGRSLVATTPINATSSRVAAYGRSILVNQAIGQSMVGLKTKIVSFTSSIRRTETVARAASYTRAITAPVARSETVTRLTALSRAFLWVAARTETVTGTAQHSGTNFNRAITSTILPFVAAARQAAYGRSIVQVAPNVVSAVHGGTFTRTITSAILHVLSLVGIHQSPTSETFTVQARPTTFSVQARPTQFTSQSRPVVFQVKKRP